MHERGNREARGRSKGGERGGSWGRLERTREAHRSRRQSWSCSAPEGVEKGKKWSPERIPVLGDVRMARRAENGCLV